MSPSRDRIERLYREDGPRLWRALLGFTGDAEMASEAAAEAYAQALARGEEVREPDRWIWRAAFRIAAGDLKRRGHHAPLVEQSYEVPEPLHDLTHALRLLSPKQRGAVLLHHYAGFPVRETALILGSTAGAVKVHLHRGRARLRELLGEG